MWKTVSNRLIIKESYFNGVNLRIDAMSLNKVRGHDIRDSDIW